MTENASVSALSRRYVRAVYWSDEDGCYVGSLPEICGPCCDAADPEDVYKQLDEIAFDYAKDKLEGTDLGTIPDPGNLSFIIKTRRNHSENSAATIAQIRKKLNVSQGVFADMLGVSRYTVQKWEKGTRSPEGAAVRLLQIVAKHPDCMLTPIGA